MDAVATMMVEIPVAEDDDQPRPKIRRTAKCTRAAVPVVIGGETRAVNKTMLNVSGDDQRDEQPGNKPDELRPGARVFGPFVRDYHPAVVYGWVSAGASRSIIMSIMSFSVDELGQYTIRFACDEAATKTLACSSLITLSYVKPGLTVCVFHLP